jgi:hypothetical protein
VAKGDVKAGRSTLIGAAGEYFAMGELLRRGWLAGLTPRGARDFDIVATKDGLTIHVRVKTKTADSKLFRWNLREDGRVFRTPIRDADFCVLVDIGGAAPEYYVILTPQVEHQLQKIRSDWLAGKATRSATNRVIAFEFGRDDDWLSNSEIGPC